MEKSKLVIALRLLNGEERNQFERFLQSPFFFEGSQSEDLRILFEIIKTYILSDGVDGLSREAIFELLYPNQGFVKGKLDKLMSALFRQLKVFLFFISEKREEAFELKVQMATAKFFKEKRYSQGAKQTLKQLYKTIESYQKKGSKQLFFRYEVEREVSHFEVLFNNKKLDVNIASTLKALDFFYMAIKIECISALLFYTLEKKNIKENIIQLIEEVDWWIQKEVDHVPPIIYTYNKAMKLLQIKETEDDNEFNDLINAIDKHEEELPSHDLKTILVMARGYCVYKYNSGSLKHLRLAFDMYKKHLIKGYLYHSGKLLPYTIVNIVSFGLKLGEFDYVKQFIDDHQDKIIGTNQPKELYHFCLSNYYFKIENYGKALENLRFNNEDTFYNIAAKRLEIKIYYEQKSVLLDAKMDSFKVFIFRMSKKLLSDVHKAANNNFIDSLRQILNPKTQGNAERIEKLRSKISEEKSFSEKWWLLEKLDELL